MGSASTSRSDRAGTSRSPHREIPSYLVRRGRTGPTSVEARTRLWPRFGLDLPSADLGRFRLLEIGFGMGEATAAMAAADPRPLLAVDVHPAGVAALLRRLEAGGLDHVRVLEGDVVHVLPELTQLDEVRLFFPDPWPKARHAKRRLLRPSFAQLLASRLAPEGFLHLATDSSRYVEHAHEALSGWEVAVVPRPQSRPVTGYERRALAAGREVTDLVARPPRA